MVDYRDDYTQRTRDDIYKQSKSGGLAGPMFALLVILAIIGGIFMYASSGTDNPTAPPEAMETVPETAPDPVPAPQPAPTTVQ
ncbi:MAG: hypothetical protein AAFO77_10485 [Pseudomonadota bacterium]